MLQGEATTARPSNNVIRQRVYASALDYFTHLPQGPTQGLAQLKTDVKLLISFWQVLYADGKYIKKEIFLSKENDVPFMSNLTQLEPYVEQLAQSELFKTLIISCTRTSFPLNYDFFSFKLANSLPDQPHRPGMRLHHQVHIT
ncbi:hypothetical protein NECAME_14034 [Necator americanus]|uniref:Uncharacterized protein n=1 Tax=Necator americanus TaxID=51031 RepID=W2SQI0_NECAM|nr:hypothetical protein NECAME_14034 [Necator americanus]ETN71989.1 hypothetical protein NECAME_14034 [Necator americanus]